MYVPGLGLTPDESLPTEYPVFGLQCPSIEHSSIVQPPLVATADPFAAPSLQEHFSQTVLIQIRKTIS